MDDSLAAEIRRLVAAVCHVPAAEVGDGPLIEYGLDSVRAVDLIISIEERFGIQIPDEEAGRMRTVADLSQYVARCTTP